METFYYAMTSDGPRFLNATSGEEATREIYEDYYLRTQAKYVFTVTKVIERPEDGWTRDEFQMELPL
jgi:hypothetical protein